MKLAPYYLEWQTETKQHRLGLLALPYTWRYSIGWSTIFYRVNTYDHYHIRLLWFAYGWVRQKEER